MEYYDDMSKKINILLISYYFPPSTSIGAVRINALYNFLKNEGYNVKVVSSKFNSEKKQNPKKIKKGFRPSKYFRSIDRTVFSKYIFSNLKTLKQLKSQYDIIISSYKPIASIILGIFFKMKNKNSKLFIEQRDLISQFGRKKRLFPIHFIDKLIDRFYISFADEIIVVSPSSKKKAEKFYKKKVNLIFNGIDIRKNYFKPISRGIKILYAGNLSKVRNLNLICGHINSCDQEIELIVASKENPKFFGGDYDFVKYEGFIPRIELEKLIMDVNYLLILEGFDKDSEENIPGKLFEYLSYNKPIMANCSENSEIMKILLETKSGINVNKYENFQKYLEIRKFNTSSSIEKYLRQNQFKEYLKLINAYEKK